MLRYAILGILWLGVATLATAADNSSGRLWLKDAANGDAKVGPNVQDGIPQGHVLKVAISDAHVGKKGETSTACTLILSDASRELTRASVTFSASGYGETLFPIAMTMTPGMYQIRLSKPGEDGKQTGLGGTFRVIEAAPPVNLPFTAPGVIVVLGAIAIGLFVVWRRPRRA